MKALGMLGECARDMPAPSHSVSTASGLLQLYPPLEKGCSVTSIPHSLGPQQPLL